MFSPVILLSANPLQSSVEVDMSMTSKSSHVSQSNHKSQNNKNSNNNHNSQQMSPEHGDSEQLKDAGEDEKREIMLEESRRVVESFLKRSLSQNAKTSLESLHPEGYHKLQRDGKLAFYQRQQSKPERGSLARRESRLARPGLPSRPSLNELTSEAKKQSQLIKPEEAIQYNSARDVRMPVVQDEPEGSPIIEKLISADANDNYFQSSDSLPSTGEDYTHMPRRKSFSKATRKSVISYIEGKKRNRENSGDAGTSPEAKSGSQDKKRVPVPPGSSRTPDMTRKYSTKHQRKLSVSEPLTNRYARQISDGNKDDDVRSSSEKRLSVRERVKKLMAGPSNKKKLQYKKSFEQRSTTVENDGADKNAYRASGKGTASTAAAPHRPVRTSSKERSIVSRLSPLPQRRNTPESRSPSPTKSKLLAKPLRSGSAKSKTSPKIKHRTLPTTGSSLAAQDICEDGELTRRKSGSLPFSVRLDATKLATIPHDRRFSEDLTSARYATGDGLKRPPSPGIGPVRPHHLDLTHKKKSSGKLKRLLQFWKKRYPSISSSSSESSRSQSLPSLPAAVDQETARQVPGTLDEETAFRDDTQSRPNERFEDGTMSDTQEVESTKPFQHRGSLSMSAGDLDGLTSDEKREVYDEIDEALQRICSKYNRYIQNVSSAPGSRITTPESSMTSEDFGSFVKATRSDPIVLRQDSTRSGKPPVHPTKSFRMFTDQAQPALNAYRNIVHQRRSSRITSSSAATKMPNNLTRRHTHHTFTGSLDSPYNRHRVSRRRPPGVPEKPEEVENRANGVPAGQDVVDAGIFDESDAPPADRVPRRSLHVRERSIISDDDSSVPVPQLPTQGSEVDGQYYYTSPSPRQERTIFDAVGDRPSTSMGQFGPSTAGDEPPGQIDEDKLVEVLVAALCRKGDIYNKSLDPMAMEPVFRTSMAQYMADSTFSHFRHFTNRFCNCFMQLVETSPSRHPEVVPVVMMFNMIGAVVEIVSSEATRQVVDNVVDFSSRMLTDLCRGRSLETLLEDLHDTEEELSSVETPNSDSHSPRRPGATDDEKELD